MKLVRERTLNQKVRFALLVAEVMILCLASWLAFGRFFPSGDDKGFWFYTALLGLLLGNRLDTPFFTTPAGVVLYAAPAAVALALSNSWGQWKETIRAGYLFALAFCILAGVLGIVAMLTVDAKSAHWQRTSNVSRVLAEAFGAPTIIYSVVILFALFAFHTASPQEFIIVAGAWILTGVYSLPEWCIRLWGKLKRIFRSRAIFHSDGEVVAYQTPNLILVRQSPKGTITPCDVIAVHDPLGQTRLALALDYVGRDEGVLLRTIEIPDAKISPELHDRLSELRPNSVVCLSTLDESIDETLLVKSKFKVVGIVAPETSIERLYFEVVKEEGVEEGRLVEVPIGKRLVTYQLLNGLTKEEIVQQKNTHGFARAQAQKIGEWEAGARRFKLAKWLPQPNAPVFLKESKKFEAQVDAVGHFPGTDYAVTLRRKNGAELGLHTLVTHNTAILGILGVGKSSIALELVERMMVENIKAICLDLTNQYAAGLAPYYDAAGEAERIKKLKTIGQAGKANVKKNVEEGGSRSAFAKAILEEVTAFVNGPDHLKIFNPAQFEVWRQDSKPFQDTASMASLTPPEITHIISDATLQVVSGLGMTDKARVCLVYEEAHSLVPEWNSAVAEGDRAAANGTARAILQGRKYGLGCLLISQRTANVTKTILNQCNTVFAMRIFDDTGKEFLANYLGREYADILPSLEERHAVFIGRASNCENPVLIRANDREDFLRVFRAVHSPTLTTVDAAKETTWSVSGGVSPASPPDTNGVKTG